MATIQNGSCEIN